MLLSIIIVNYNVKYFLEQCLCSVQKAVEHLEAEILVVDNASTDESVEYLAPLFPSVIFTKNTENTGFSRANNQALQRARGRYILFLNPDTIIPESSLQRCISFLESHASAGACGIRMLDGSGRYLPESKRGFPTIQASFFKLSGLTRLFPRSRHLAGYYMGHLDENQDQEVDVLAGAFFLATRQVLEATGGFDEQFFMYGEDIDLSYRIRQAGHTLHYLEEPPIIHFKGESTRRGSLPYINMFYKAMSLFVRKHHGAGKSRLFTGSIELSIRLRAFISVAANLFRRSTPTRDESIRTLVVGSDDEFTRVSAILNRNPHPSRKLSQVKTIADLKQAFGTSPGEIIFCAGNLSYREIISLIERLPKRISFRIHSSGSQSIVGSDLKHSSGSVMG